MRIALDARTIYRPTRRGTGKNLIDLYTHLAQARPEWRVTAYHRGRDVTPSFLPWPQVQPRFMEMPGDRFHAWERFRLPMAARRDRVDLLHCPANTCPSWMPTPTLVTIHDLIPLDHPQGRSAGEVRHFGQSIETACRQASWIICPSQYTRDRLAGEFNADASRITVNPWAADSSMRHVEAGQRQDVIDEYGMNKPYVLHFGAAAPRKNTRRVIEAWGRLSLSMRRDWQLVVVGLDARSYTAMQQLVEHRGLQGGVLLHGFAPEADLPALMSGASILAFPSLAEGFGLPILDAWATRTSVLTSRCTSLPEVAGQAAELVDPQDTDDIARGLNRLMSSQALRDQLVTHGLQRLTQYNWRATTDRFIRAVEAAARISHQSLAA